VQDKVNFFEKHPKKISFLLWVVIVAILYGLLSFKMMEGKSIKTLIHQYIAGKMIDNNVGRFIKLREHRPNETRRERPSRHYISQVTPGALTRRFYTLSTDQDGFIKPSMIHADPDISLVFLGGSTTECRYMDEHERFPYLVGRILEEKWKKKVNSYNGGVSGNESMHSLNILLNKVLPLKPDSVILMHNINDLNILRSQGSYGYTHSLKSHLQTSKNVFSPYEFPPTPVSIEEKAILREFQSNLETFIAICQIRHIQPILMTQANRVKDDPLYHRFNEIIREVGKAKKVQVIDLAKKIPATSENLYDTYHYTAKGSALAAKTIAKAISKSE